MRKTTQQRFERGNTIIVGGTFNDEDAGSPDYIQHGCLAVFRGPTTLAVPAGQRSRTALALLPPSPNPIRASGRDASDLVRPQSIKVTGCHSSVGAG